MSGVFILFLPLIKLTDRLPECSVGNLEHLQALQKLFAVDVADAQRLT